MELPVHLVSVAPNACTLSEDLLQVGCGTTAHWNHIDDVAVAVAVVAVPVGKDLLTEDHCTSDGVEKALAMA